MLEGPCLDLHGQVYTLLLVVLVFVHSGHRHEWSCCSGTLHTHRLYLSITDTPTPLCVPQPVFQGLPGCLLCLKHLYLSSWASAQSSLNPLSMKFW